MRKMTAHSCGAQGFNPMKGDKCDGCENRKSMRMDAISQLVQIELPWPPSVNHYWTRTRSGMTIGKSGRLYIQSVQAAVLIAGCRRNISESIEMSILAYPPDARRRDLDNTLKATLDSLQKCGVYKDDYQIFKLTIERMRASKPGRLEVHIREV